MNGGVVRVVDPDPAPDEEAETLESVVPRVRVLLDLPPSFTDEAILRSLQKIADARDRVTRWRAAFASELGRELASSGIDLHSTLKTVMGMLPLQRG
jgi:hypothetical protein